MLRTMAELLLAPLTALIIVAAIIVVLDYYGLNKDNLFFVGHCLLFFLAYILSYFFGYKHGQDDEDQVWLNRRMR
jgi:high-affinity nickel permease